MSKVCQLYSGSSGNCIFIGDSSKGILIDAGVSAKKIKEGLDYIGIEPDNIKAIFITHEHTDHTSGLRVFAGRHNIPTFATAGTAEELEHSGCANGTFPLSVIGNGEIEIDGFSVNAFHTSHDVADSCGYVVTLPDQRKVAVCTDLGYVSETVHNAISGVDTIFIESNHDVDMLKNGFYTADLKRRILGVCGHLSNVDCASEILRLAQSGTTRFILSHLSEQNNTPFLAEKQTVSLLSDYDMERGKDYLLYISPKSLGDIVVF